MILSSCNASQNPLQLDEVSARCVVARPSVEASGSTFPALWVGDVQQRAPTGSPGLPIHQDPQIPFLQHTFLLDEAAFFPN